MRSNHKVGRGVIAPKRQQPTSSNPPPATKRTDYNMATPAQAAAIRERYIAAGIIGGGKPIAATAPTPVAA